MLDGPKCVDGNGQQILTGRQTILEASMQGLGNTYLSALMLLSQKGTILLLALNINTALIKSSCL